MATVVRDAYVKASTIFVDGKYNCSDLEQKCEFKKKIATNFFFPLLIDDNDMLTFYNYQHYCDVFNKIMCALEKKVKVIF